jgi:hypothetical protein
MRGCADDMVSEYRVDGFGSSPAADEELHTDPKTPTLHPVQVAESIRDYLSLQNRHGCEVDTYAYAHQSDTYAPRCIIRDYT